MSHRPTLRYCAFSGLHYTGKHKYLRLVSAFFLALAVIFQKLKFVDNANFRLLQGLEVFANLGFLTNC